MNAELASLEDGAVSLYCLATARVGRAARRFQVMRSTPSSDTRRSCSCKELGSSSEGGMHRRLEEPVTDERDENG